MAEGVTPDPGKDLEPTRKAELESAQSKELTKYSPQVKHGHEHKFRFTYGVLAGVGLAAVVAAGAFIVAGKPPKPPEWSPWKPTASGDEALAQIANHVAPAYRLPTGEQLVAVDGGPPQLAGFPVKILLRPTRDDFAPTSGKSAMFSFCGLGKNCSIRSGKPSLERTLLMERESLELALYTFRYVSDVQQVVVLLAPPPGKPPSQAMFFKRDDVKPQLERPLRFTLPGKPPSLTALRKGPARNAVLGLDKNVYNFNVVQAPDATVVLELDRLTNPSASSGTSSKPTSTGGASKSAGGSSKSAGGSSKSSGKTR